MLRHRRAALQQARFPEHVKLSEEPRVVAGRHRSPRSQASIYARISMSFQATLVRRLAYRAC